MFLPYLLIIIFVIYHLWCCYLCFMFLIVINSDCSFSLCLSFLPGCMYLVGVLYFFFCKFWLPTDGFEPTRCPASEPSNISHRISKLASKPLVIWATSAKTISMLVLTSYGIYGMIYKVLVLHHFVRPKSATGIHTGACNIVPANPKAVFVFL